MVTTGPVASTLNRPVRIPVLQFHATSHTWPEAIWTVDPSTLVFPATSDAVQERWYVPSPTSWMAKVIVEFVRCVRTMDPPANGAQGALTGPLPWRVSSTVIVPNTDPRNHPFWPLGVPPLGED